MGIINKKLKNDFMAVQKNPNWTPYAVAAAICLALGFFFFIDGDAVRHDADTGKLWDVLAGVFFGLFVLSWFIGYLALNRRKF